ncbi:hypothetical protein [Cesiribacter andamanensis]|uniref:DUF3575 domain-containing protein n=1 Tax=Cesiribacter andamanensis AMV16 TaxID=1279009 RepID=M7P1X2_9BACT|nr:hypothetical protein [Cesiribacter andamanensis]EMR04589.1 hypothetical protein ADICEAN_00191 [Cesiribacter andamanensis AMV16]
MKLLYSLAALLLLLPLAGRTQQATVSPEPLPAAIPWTKSITAGFSIWPVAKERLRLGYSWEHMPNKHWVLEGAYVNAIERDFLFQNNSTVLEGGQLRGEHRWYDPGSRNSFFYYGAMLAYMYSQYPDRVVEGFECNEQGDCAYFKQSQVPVRHHTGNVGFTLGWVVRATPVFMFNFHGGIGLQGTRFSGQKNDDFFGRGAVFAESKQFVLEPRLRLGMNLQFALRQRNQAAND